jgi:adenine-specific DNA-methyltransferase
LNAVLSGFATLFECKPLLNNRITKEGKGFDLNEELNTKGKQYTADGLLDIFSRYKFTVDENTPLDEEVALDPELLGKVFENLLASYNEDTKTTARKQSGSFYTPREVVDYMVDEAIIAYVLPKLEDGTPEDNRQKLQSLLSYTESGNPFDEDLTAGVIMTLAELKILDPACGSGAFPMGALNKLVLMLSKLDANNKLWQRQHERRLNEDLAKATKAENADEVEALTAELIRLKTNFEQQTAEYTRKLYLIENSIYGVDIQPIAVQIAKLRFFIALIVSQQVDAKKPNRGMLALPNLETRIVAANGLQPLSDKGQAVMDSDALRALRKQLIEQQSHYFRANDRQKKKTAQNKIELLQTEIQKECFLLGYGDMSARLLSFHPFDQNSSSQFFEPNIMFGFDKFNMVIGNPPYVRQESIKHLKDQFKKNYACFTGVADLYVYFYERSFDLLEPNGSFAFITSNKWYRANYGAKLRDWMKINTRIHQVIDFGDEAVFTALAYPTIVIATKREQVKQPADHELIKALNWDQSTNPNIFDFPRIFAKHHFSVQQASLQPKGWQLEPQGKRDVLERLRAAGKPLGEYVNGQLYYGIKTGLNDAFVIDGATRAQLIEKDAKSAEIIKPFLRGRDVKRWQVQPQDLWLIFTRRGININNYPAIKKHLSTFKEQLMPKPAHWSDTTDGAWQGRKAGSYEWFEIQDNIAYWQEFGKDKIIFPDIATSPQFTFDNSGYYLANTAYVLPTTERSMVAILNSYVSTWFYAQISPQIQNGYFRFIAQYVEQIPIPEATAHQKHVLETLVDEIMISKERPKLERLMNALVYQLFFPEEFKAAGINLFQICTKIGLLNCSDNPDFQKILATIHSFPIVQTIEDIIATPKDSQA